MTDMLLEIDQDYLTVLRDSLPKKEFMSARDAAFLIFETISNSQRGHINGQIFSVDSGYEMWR